MVKYFSKDGNTQYGLKYKHLSTHEVEMPEKPDKKEGHNIVAKMDIDTKEGYWKQQKITKTPDEEINLIKTDQTNTMKALVELHMELLELKGES